MKIVLQSNKAFEYAEIQAKLENIAPVKLVIFLFFF